MAKRQMPDASGENWSGELLREETSTKKEKFENGRRDNKICTRFIIPSKYAGQLIGKKGAHINSLRDTYGVQIAIPDSSTSERLCRVMSEDIDDILECIRDISVKLGPDMVALNTRLNEGQTEMRLLVNKAHCGGIIGAKGARIKELREATGATINMHGECCPGSTDRILQVGGEPDAVIDTLRKVVEHLATLEPPAENQRYEPGVNANAAGIHYGGIKGDGTVNPMMRADQGYMRNDGGKSGMGLMNPYRPMNSMYGMPPHGQPQYPPMPYGYPYGAYPQGYPYPMPGYMPYAPYSAPQQRGGNRHHNNGDQGKRNGGFGHGSR